MMRRFLGISLWLIACCVCIAPAVAFWQSRDSNYNVNIAGGGPSCAGGTVLFDVSGATDNSGASPATLQPTDPNTAVAMNLGGGANGTTNRALLVYVGQRTGALGGVSSVTWNGVAMGLVGVDGANGSIFGLVAPATGQNSLVVTFSGGGTVSVFALSVVGACQTGGATTFHDYASGSATSSLATQTVTSANGEIALGGFISGGVAFSTSGTGCTDINRFGSGTNPQAACWAASTGATVTVSYNLSTSGFWLVGGVSVKGN